MSELHVYYSSLTWQQYKQQPIVWKASLVAQRLKRLPPMRETRIWSLDREDPLEKEMAPHSSTLAWRIPWMEEPGRLQSTGSQRTGHDWAASLSLLQSTCRYATFITCEIGTMFYRWEVWRIREYVTKLVRGETSVGSESLIRDLLCIPHAILIFCI